MSQRKLRKYDKEFKLNAIKFCIEGGYSYRQVCNELGIPIATLAAWIEGYKKDGAEAFPGKGHIKTADIEVVRLRKELAIAREERDILKKALGIFSSQPK
jgi:transposase-like protein